MSTPTQKLRDALAQSGLTQEQIAKHSGATQRAVSEFLSGRGIRSDTFDALAVFVGVEFRVPKNFPKNIRKRIDGG